ncbi:MAG: hypothetical protein AAF652_14795 [Cyanobacteria bacterium P01_C01_bin.72]
MMDVICMGDGDVPLFVRIGDGNESDRAIFAQLMKQFKQEWNLDSIYVADSALAGCGSSQVASSDALSLWLCAQKIFNNWES